MIEGANRRTAGGTCGVSDIAAGRSGAGTGLGKETNYQPGSGVLACADGK